jgi:hypothetical protein
MARRRSARDDLNFESWSSSREQQPKTMTTTRDRSLKNQKPVRTTVALVTLAILLGPDCEIVC